jgi:hypothetical protein
LRVTIIDLFLQKKENNLVMKKIALIGTVLFIMALGFQSCKSTADCPAYSQVQTEQPVLKA